MHDLISEVRDLKQAVSRTGEGPPDQRNVYPVLASFEHTYLRSNSTNLGLLGLSSFNDVYRGSLQYVEAPWVWAVTRWVHTRFAGANQTM